MPEPPATRSASASQDVEPGRPARRQDRREHAGDAARTSRTTSVSRGSRCEASLLERLGHEHGEHDAEHDPRTAPISDVMTASKRISAHLAARHADRAQHPQLARALVDRQARAC